MYSLLLRKRVFVYLVIKVRQRVVGYGRKSLRKGTCSLGIAGFGTCRRDAKSGIKVGQCAVDPSWQRSFQTGQYLTY